jgi:hypothetical protein
MALVSLTAASPLDARRPIIRIETPRGRRVNRVGPRLSVGKCEAMLGQCGGQDAYSPRPDPMQGQ